MAYQMGFQIYSIRNRAQADLRKSFHEIAEAGFEGVELAGLYGHSVEDVKAWAKEAGLVIVSAHVGLDEFLEDPGKTVLTYRELGCQYLAVPYLSEKWRKDSNYRWLIKQLIQLGEYCNQFNIELLYHNHDFELLLIKENEENLLNNIFAEVPDHFLKTELDTAWLKVAGEEPTAYLERYRGRCPLVHVKDFEQLEKPSFCPLGTGVQKMNDIVQKAVACEAKWLIAEQDNEQDISEEAVRLNAQYLKEQRERLQAEGEA